MNKHYFDGIEWEADVVYSGAPMSVVMSFANEEEMRKIDSARIGKFVEDAQRRLRHDNH